MSPTKPFMLQAHNSSVSRRKPLKSCFGLLQHRLSLGRKLQLEIDVLIAGVIQYDYGVIGLAGLFTV